jgi:hypothetical protein
MDKTMEEAFTEAALSDADIYNVLMRAYESRDVEKHVAEQLAVFRMATGLLALSLEKALPTQDWFRGK